MEEQRTDLPGPNGGYNAAPRNLTAHRVPDPAQGLSSAEANARMLEGKSNVPVKSPTKTVGQIILGNLFTYFNLIFAVIALALIIVRSSWANLTFLGAVACNTLIGTIQEIRSKRTLDKLTLLHAPVARAVRDGREISLPVDQLVLDDVSVFSAGDQITADGEILAGEVQVNEALITGESEEITKRVGDSLKSGSFVVSGSCRAVLTAVGADSFVSQLTLEAKKRKRHKEIGMTRSLNHLITFIGIILVPVGAGLIMRHLSGTDMSAAAWRDAVEATSAALIGMIPEGLYLLVSVALAVSVIRLSRKNTLCHDLKCIETLARVDVLCVDKTGTITENEMKVADLLVMPKSGLTKESAAALLSDFVANVSQANDTMLALQSHFKSDHPQRATQVIPFTSSTKYTGVSFGNRHFVLGAPEFILRDRFPQYENAIAPFVRNGNRVLLLASVPALPGGPLSLPCEPLALVLLNNPVRANAPATFAYFHKQGVTVKVISGDNPVTASAAAEQANIPDAEKYIDATALNTYEKVKAACEEYTVFGRVTPEQKRWLIRALKGAGHTVAMTGDGINDVLALKDADCSVAMASGSEVASQVAQLVLLDNDFSHMPSVVAEGRRVINNIERSAALFLVKNIFSLFLALITISVGVAYPLQPVHLTLINIFTIGIPSFFLALEPNENRIRGQFMSSVLYRAAPSGFTNVFLVGFVLAYRELFHMDAGEVGTVSAILIGFVGMMMLYRVCQPFNLMRRILWIALLVGLTVSCFVSSVFTSDVILSRLSVQSILVLLTFLLMAYPVMRVLSDLEKKAEVLYHRAVARLKRFAAKC